jgi:hypothetical protein
MDFERTQFDDDRLDEALKKYGAAEPRAGLESRILVNLAGERERRTGRPWHWRWIAAPLAFGVAVVVGFFLTRKPDCPHVNVVNQTSLTENQEISRPAISYPIPPVALGAIAHVKKSQHHVAKVRSEPHLEQFPSPTPLNEQEEMLVRYVRERRQEAVMVARARAELLKQELADF